MLKLPIMTSLTIDRFGRVLIPKKLRDKFGLVAGQTLALSEEGGKLVLEPSNKSRLTLKNGLPIFAAGSDTDIFEAIELMREARNHETLGDS